MSYSIINIYYRMYHYLFIQLQTFTNCSLEIVRLHSIELGHQEQWGSPCVEHDVTVGT